MPGGAKVLISHIDTTGINRRQTELIFFFDLLFAPQGDLQSGTRVDFMDASQSFSRLSGKKLKTRHLTMETPVKNPWYLNPPTLIGHSKVHGPHDFVSG